MKNTIIKHLAEYQLTEFGSIARGGEYKGYWINDDECPAFTYACLENALKIPIKELKKEMIELRNIGLVHLMMTIDSEYYKPCGSGWSITEKGMIYAVDNNLVPIN